MNFPALKEAEGKLEAKRSELAAIFAEAQDGGEGTIDLKKVKEFGGDTSAAAAKIKALNDEMTALGEEADGLRAVQRAADASKADPAARETGDDRQVTRPQSLGERFVNSDAFKHRRQAAHADIDMSLTAVINPTNTLFETGTGWAPESTRSGLVVLAAERPVQVTDLLPQIPTSQSAYKYMEETTFTNNAAEKAEGTAYGEAALVLTERSQTVEKLTVWLPVTDEQLEDEEGAEAYVNARLPFMIRQKLDAQILVGDGATPDLNGVNTAATGSQAKGADPVPDAIHKGITKSRVTGRAQPNAVIFHDNDWQDVRLLRTADGIYIWGSPSEAGPERIWGLQVVKSDAQTEHTAIVGDFANYSLLVVRRGIQMQVSNSHDDFFVKGKQAVRADMRVAVVWTRPAAFVEVTGI